MKYILIEKAPELINVIRNSIIVLPSSDGGEKIVVKGDERLHMVSTYPALHSVVAIYKGDDAYLFNTRELLPSWVVQDEEEAYDFNETAAMRYGIMKEDREMFARDYYFRNRSYDRLHPTVNMMVAHMRQGVQVLNYKHDAYNNATVIVECEADPDRLPF